jgi:hypothetical protein
MTPGRFSMRATCPLVSGGAPIHPKGHAGDLERQRDHMGARMLNSFGQG